MVLVDDLLDSVISFPVVKLGEDVILVDGGCCVNRLAVRAKVKVGAFGALVADSPDTSLTMIASGMVETQAFASCLKYGRLIDTTFKSDSILLISHLPI